MYEERSEKFSLRDVLIQVLFVTLFIFLMLWLFPTKGFVNKKINKTYNEAFNNNVNAMKDSAKSYFTNERLPQKVGDEEVITLGDMLDLKIILPFVDSKGKTCDLNESYVLVTKEENEYLMKINLKCTDYEDYLLVHMGCYEYCTTAICENKDKPVAQPVVNKTTTVKKVTTTVKPTPTPTPIPNTPVVNKIFEYQYLLVVDGKWGNWSNWSDWTVNQAQRTDYREVETKVEKVASGSHKVESGTHREYASINTTYTCPVGYTLSGTNCIGTTNTTDTKPAIADITYSCPSGYSLSGNMCYSQGTTNERAQATSRTTYNCNHLSGYTVSGSSCIKRITTTDTKSAKATTTQGNWVYSHQTTSSVTLSNTSTTRYTLVGTKVNTNCTAPCTNSITYTYNVYKLSGGGTTYSCSHLSGYTLSGSSCVKTTTTTDTKSALSTTTYTCPAGYDDSQRVGSTCYRRITVSDSRPATEKTNYRCDYMGYYLSGSLCIKTGITTTNITATPSYSCPAGYIQEGTTCYKNTTTYIDETTYSEVTYYRMRTREYVSGTRLYKWSRSQNDTNLISAGYTLTGVTREVQ